MKKKAIFLLIDALRYDTLARPEAAKYLFPNLAEIAEQGFTRRVVANAQGTQFVMPSLFSLTYPLDHGGYNTGIRDRPRSFPELLQAAGWETHRIATANQLGVHHGYERGFDTVRTATDFRGALEHHLDRVLRHDIDLWRRGERSEAESIVHFQKDFGLLLRALDQIWRSFDKSMWPPRLLRINRRVVRGLDRERHLVEHNPLLVMSKISKISGGAYWRFLGEVRIRRFKRLLWHGVGYAGGQTRRWISAHTFPPYFRFPHFPLVMQDVVAKICEFLEDRKDRQWFAYIHIMDVHDCRAINRPLRTLARWRFFPRWLVGRARGYTQRRFLYDAALMQVDVGVGAMIQALRKSGQLDETIVLVTGDHGSSYAENPRGKKSPVQVRTHYEDIEVPLILFGAETPPDDHGLIDSMGMTASLLDALGVPADPSFKGASVYRGGREAVISESCGSGNADLARRDIFFTVTSATHRMMATLTKSNLDIRELFDLTVDPKEINNLVGSHGAKSISDRMTKYLRMERSELFEMRGQGEISPEAHQNAS